MAIMERRTPWHFWLVTILALLFYGGGSYNYLMMQSDNAAYLESYTPEQLAYFETAPIWFDAAWAIGVWFALLGALLMLLKSRFAVSALLLGLVGFAIATLHQFSGAAPASMTTGLGMISTIVLGVIQVAIFVYAMAMARKRVLR
ncbi:hypothetical protein [Aurantiacibacter rhizosphaerae]|uniref:Sugar transporter n=1 Tax=Aurantiacibacter rhizosphaerae TaxID=2691582 RepID=A0A844XD72_9SPHN|nr:hypothetical protein [Aurantiacibacter rhizosphaerae]MWV27455.1 hypothetical protein [Aurantiacibacter rhizosphaerae]